MFRNALTRAIARRLLARAATIVRGRAPDVIIGGSATPYLHRWWLLPRNRVLNVYLHEFMRDDDDRALHDHPWWSLSLTLSGHMWEVYTRRGSTLGRGVWPGALIFRGGKFAHRMIVIEPRSMTLFITGPRFREWGFLCPKGWRRWQDFCAPGDSSSVGPGCD